MAIARANCKCTTCGQTFEVCREKRNISEARSWEAWAEAHLTECQECEDKRIRAARDAENAQAAMIAQEMGYPELIGTEKQKAWATSIREQTMALMQEKLLDPDRLEKSPEARLTYEIVKDILLKMRAAGWWIDHKNMIYSISNIDWVVEGIDPDRYTMLNRIITAVHKGEMTLSQAEEALKKPDTAAAEAQTEVEAPKAVKPQRPEAVPEKKKFEGCVDVRIEGTTVTAIYDKNDTFRQIVKKLRFTWSTSWTLTCGERTGTPENVAAELGNRLLNAGFAVRFDNEAIMDAAVRGEYEPMYHRWIISHSDGFYVTWPREDDLYYEIKTIPGAKYDTPGIIIPERSWAAVADLAAKRGFRFTAKAQAKMDALSGAAATVAPAKPAEPHYDEHNVLRSSREVIPDLRDDDATAN